jgi:hypothetical protein
MKALTYLNARRSSIATTFTLIQGSLYLRIAVLLGALLMSTLVTRADLLWDWSYQTSESFTSGLFFTGSGTLTTSSTPSDGFYTVTGITGTWTLSPGDNPGPTYTITGLISPGGDGGLNSSVGQNDNLLALGSPQLTNYAGIGFTDSSGATDAIYFANNEGPDGAYRGGTDPSGTPAFDDVAFFTAAPVPEPSSWAMFVGGMGALLFFVARRRRRA